MSYKRCPGLTGLGNQIVIIDIKDECHQGILTENLFSDFVLFLPADFTLQTHK